MPAFQLKSSHFDSNMAFKYTHDLSGARVERYKNTLLPSQEFISSWQIILCNKINFEFCIHKMHFTLLAVSNQLEHLFIL